MTLSRSNEKRGQDHGTLEVRPPVGSRLGSLFSSKQLAINSKHPLLWSLIALLVWVAATYYGCINGGRELAEPVAKPSPKQGLELYKSNASVDPHKGKDDS